MNAERFWEIIESTGTPTELHDRLAALSPEDLLSFEYGWDRMMSAAYRWDLWGAAYVLGGGCGDDSFEYFRAYLISRGRAAYELGISDPDGLATIDFEDEDAWEEWMSPTMAVVHRRTGEYAFAGPPDAIFQAPGDPAGEPWDEEDLPERFPRMTARHG